MNNTTEPETPAQGKIKSKWIKLPPVASDKIHHGCICCSNVQQIAHKGMWIAVGFGDAHVSKDGEPIWNESDESHKAEGENRNENLWTLEDAEQAAALDPDHDWRIVKFGPLHGEVYQRQEPGKWVLIESNMGFA